METVTSFVRAWTYQTTRFDRDNQANRAGATKCTEMIYVPVCLLSHRSFTVRHLDILLPAEHNKQAFLGLPKPNFEGCFLLVRIPALGSVLPLKT